MHDRSAAADRAHRRRARVRLPQRAPRCGELDRDDRLDPRAAAEHGGHLGGVLQFHRLPVLRAARRQDRSATGSSTPRSSTPRRSSARSSGAIIWNIITWLLGIPSSSSHALIGGLVGAGVAKAGLGAIIWYGLVKTAAAIVLSPLIGFMLGAAADARRCRGSSSARRRSRSTRWFRGCSSSRRRSIRSATAATTRRRRWASSPCCSTRRACCGGEFHVPFWVVLTCQVAMALGTLFGGWRIVHTMGSGSPG